MRCISCQHPETKVIESRESKSGDTIRRRRECTKCFYRFTTFEHAEDKPIYVIKRDGTRELFDSQKLLKSMSIACRKRSVSVTILKDACDWIERQCQKLEEVPSQTLGDLALSALRTIDPVAYVRFASVYRAFGSAEDFVKELKSVEEQSKHSEYSEDWKKDS